MEKLFLSVLEITLGTSAVILALLLLQPLTAKFLKRKWRYWAWLILAVRLLIPFSLSQTAVFEFTLPAQEIVVESPAAVPSTVPNTPVTPSVPDNIQTDVIVPDEPVIPQEPVQTRPNIYVRPSTSTPAVSQEERTVPVMEVLGVLWLVGAGVVFLWQIGSYLLFSRRVRCFSRVPEDERLLTALDQITAEMNLHRRVRLYTNKRVQSPLLIGFFRPAILLPANIENFDDILMILRHELMHLKRGDTWYKLLVRLACAMHWYNPLVWIMAKFADSDLENACDEDVVKNRGEEFRHSYCESILRAIRSQKSREPMLAAGFASKPSELRARFMRILDMTKKRGGKTALILLLCVSLLCGAFIGCDLAGVIDSSSSDTSSDQNEEEIPFSVQQTLEKDLKIKLSEDPEMVASLMNEYNYSSLEIIFEDTRSLDTQTEYVNVVYTETRTTVYKTSLFKITTFSGEKLVLMQSEKSYTYEDGLIVSQSVDSITYNDVLTQNLSVTDFSGAKLVMSDDCESYAVYLPSSDSMLMTLNDSYRLVEIVNQDENDPLLLNWIQTYPTLSLFADSLSDQFVFAAKKNSENYLVYYDASEKTLTPFGNMPIGDLDNDDYVSLLSEESGIISLSCQNAILFFDLNSADPFTPISVIGKDDIGKDFTPVRMAVSDRNDNTRFVMAYTDADYQLGFVTFDLSGNYTHSFDMSGMYVYSSADLYNPVFVDNIIYFTNISSGYFTREYRKYAVDARKGTGNVPTLQNETLLDDDNVALEDFDYSRDAKAYPFELYGNVKVVMYGTLSSGGKDGNMFSFGINNVTFDAKTGNISAKAQATNAFLSGKLQFNDIGELYFTPDNYEYLPRPYDEKTTKVMPVLISANDTVALREYVNSLNIDQNNAVITVKNLVIERVDGVLSYTAEISEMFSGESDYITRQNQALEILQTYGIVADGKYEITTSKYYANEYVLNSPDLRLSPLSLLNYDGFNSVSDLIGWYGAFSLRSEFEGMSFNEIGHIEERFRRVWTFSADEFEKAVTTYFDIAVETLRESECYDAESGTYSADLTKYYDESRLKSASHSDFIRFGDVMQLTVYSEATGSYHHIFVKINSDGSYKFLKASSEFVGYETPIVLVTNLTD